MEYGHLLKALFEDKVRELVTLVRHRDGYVHSAWVGITKDLCDELEAALAQDAQLNHHERRDAQGFGTCDTCCVWEMKAAAYDEIVAQQAQPEIPTREVIE